MPFRNQLTVYISPGLRFIFGVSIFNLNKKLSNFHIHSRIKV